MTSSSINERTYFGASTPIRKVFQPLLLGAPRRCRGGVGRPHTPCHVVSVGHDLIQLYLLFLLNFRGRRPPPDPLPRGRGSRCGRAMLISASCRAFFRSNDAHSKNSPQAIGTGKLQKCLGLVPRPQSISSLTSASRSRTILLISHRSSRSSGACRPQTPAPSLRDASISKHIL